MPGTNNELLGLNGGLAVIHAIGNLIYAQVPPQVVGVVDDPASWAPFDEAQTISAGDDNKLGPITTGENNEVSFLHCCDDFFETVHVVPRSFEFPNLLADQSIPMVAYSAFRRESHTWTDVINGAGAGVTFSGLPTLPIAIAAQQGYEFALEVSTIGEVFVDSTLDFVFDVGTIEVPITITRLILWDIRPESRYSEELQFYTDVIVAKSGKEKRQAVREYPRQTFDFLYRMDDDERPFFENRLFDFQSLGFGMPTWFFVTRLSAAATATDTTIQVESTDFRDFRVGGLVVIFDPDDEDVFDAIVIASFTSTTIELESPLLNSFPAGAEVYPLAVLRVPSTISGGRYTFGLSELRLRLAAVDTVATIADVSAFPTYKGKVLIDSGNVVRSRLVQETFSQRFNVVDGLAGVIEQTSPWDRHKRGFRLTLRAQGLEEAWNLRQLVCGLRGEQVSFYVVRDFDDLHVVADLQSGTAQMDVRNDGYAQYVRQRQPKSDIRIELVDGTVLLREILNSVVSGDPTIEGLTVDTVWPSTIPVADIVRVDYVEKLRFDSDRLTLEYNLDRRTVHLTAPVKAVFE